MVDFYGDAPYIDFAEEAYIKDLLQFLSIIVYRAKRLYLARQMIYF